MVRIWKKIFDSERVAPRTLVIVVYFRMHRYLVIIEKADKNYAAYVRIYLAVSPPEKQ